MLTAKGTCRNFGLAGTNFWCAGPRTRPVYIIPNWAHILCELHRSFVFHQAGDMLRSTGIRLRSAIDFIVHGRFCRLGRQAWCDIICFRRRHAALCPLRISQHGNVVGWIGTVHTGHWSLDVGKPSKIKPRQNRTVVDRNYTQSQ